MQGMSTEKEDSKKSKYWTEGRGERGRGTESGMRENDDQSLRETANGRERQKGAK